jgi:hypothetical protein
LASASEKKTYSNLYLHSYPPILEIKLESNFASSVLDFEEVAGLQPKKLKINSDQRKMFTLSTSFGFRAHAGKKGKDIPVTGRGGP